MNIPEISLIPPTIATIGPVNISTPMVSAFLISLILIGIGIYMRFNAKLIPGRFQVALEVIITMFLENLIQATGSEKLARRLLPFIVTLFLFVLMANQMSLIPLIGSIVLDDVTLFKTATTHYSLTIALIVLGLGTAHVIAFLLAPIRHLGTFFKFSAFLKIRSLKDVPMAFIEFFIGLMDIIGEVAKFVSVSTRLFGNLFAGEVIIVILSGLLFATQFVVPIPFIVLGILSGLVQAFVFTTLTMFFMSSTLSNVPRLVK